MPTSSAWLARIQQYAQAEQAALDAMSAPSAPPPSSAAAGVDQFFRQRGMPQSQIDSCLADPAEPPAHRRAHPARHEEHGVTGTPTFFINDTKHEGVGSWQQLEPLLRAQMGG